MKKVSLLVVVAVLQVWSVAWGAEASWRKDIKPLFDARCGGCHGEAAAPEYQVFKEEKEKWLAKGQGMRMNTYSHLVFFTAWPDTGSLMRRLDDGKNAKDGKPGNMYQHLGATEEERQKNLKLFKEWVGNWLVKRWPDVTKEELNGIKVPY